MKANRLTRCLSVCGLILFFLALSGIDLSSRAIPQHWTISLSIFPTAITFPSADPDLVPVIAANTPVQIQVTTWPPNRPWQLTIRAEGNLVSSSGQVIPINTISWRATSNPPFRDGVLAAGQSLVLAESRGDRSSDLNFSFQNSWNYVAGNYSQVITFTASLL
ncbi:MAG: hypothetical protein N3G18_07240 [Candidatus Saccharicenans sp.]|nr:hypothetical protein [Candidatus Saccharicenans sp.]